MPTESTDMRQTSSQQRQSIREDSRLYSLEMVRVGWGPGVFGLFLLVLFTVCCLFIAFVPWRQSVAGSGEIIVFSPMQRPQNIEAQISGRLLNWSIRDGEDVKKGQLIAELSDIDPRFLSGEQLKSLENQKAALAEKRDAAKQRSESLASQLADISDSRDAAVPAAKERIAQANDRLYAAQQSVDVAEQNVKTTQWQLDRITALYDKGLRSQRDQQLALLDNTRAKTELQRAKSAFDVVSKDTKIGADWRQQKQQRHQIDTTINAVFQNHLRRKICEVQEFFPRHFRVG